MKLVVLTGVLVCGCALAEASVVTRTIDYRDSDVELQGFLAYDDTITGRRPAVLVVHEWWGLNDFARDQARELAKLGYAAFALDMYGKGVVTDQASEAGRLSGPFRSDPELMRRRAKAGYDALAAQPEADPQRIAAIGFCFGGTTVLQMAYSGLPLAGVVSFHGGLVVPTETDIANLKCPTLVLHGAADTLIPAETVKSFQEALARSSADWQFVVFGGAKHAFTNPDANGVGIPGVGYDERTARRSGEYMKVFLTEVFAPRK